jgi:hypothetical protein
MNSIRFVLFVATLWVSAAQADTFSAPASACVPNLATARDNRVLAGNASVQHAAGITDLIVLTCPLPPFFANGALNWVIRITYVDSNGAAENAFVRARLYRMPVEGANPVLLETVNSNDSPDTGLNSLSSAGFSHGFDFAANVYWFHIDLDRAADAQTVILHSVALQNVAFSDVRGKHAIALLGHLENGLGFYRFSYNGSDKAYVGVMAQEVEAMRPDAVVRGSDGYLRVSYSQLGLRMQTWEEWLAAGAKIPAIAALR